MLQSRMPYEQSFLKFCSSISFEGWNTKVCPSSLAAISAMISDFPLPVGKTMIAFVFFALLLKKETAASEAFCW